MPLDYEVRRPTQRCAVGDRALSPGEAYYSVLLEEKNEVLRRDIASAAWQGPPENAIGWWRCHTPSNDGKPQPAPREVMLGLLDQWANDPSKVSDRYLLALLLVRRRVLRIEQAGFALGLKNQQQDQHQLVLSCAERDEPFQVTIAPPSESEAARIEERLSELLGVPSTDKKHKKKVA